MGKGAHTAIECRIISRIHTLTLDIMDRKQLLKLADVVSERARTMRLLEKALKKDLLQLLLTERGLK